ncbi:hypothetical protein ADL21_11955 [Streptomyces albus subsp. albus]|nr:hypothetical protein ADL21_11955 [Streptomyces albus subsp. albus]
MKSMSKRVLAVTVGTVAAAALAAPPVSAAEQKSLWDLAVAMQGGSGHSGDNFTEVVLINGTSKTLHLTRDDLYGGHYSKGLKPPQDIKSGQAVNIATKGTFLKGTRDKIKYSDGDDFIEFDWENPFFGKNTYNVQSSGYMVSGVDVSGHTWGIPGDLDNHHADSSTFGGGNRALVGFVIGDGASLVKGTYKNAGSKCDDYDRALSGVSMGNGSSPRSVYQDGEIGMIIGAIAGKIIAGCV